MDSLFHLAVSYLSGMAINPRLNHRPEEVLAVSILSVGIDIDHLLFSYPRAFHTVFIVLLLPSVLFYISYRYERNSESIKYQTLSILLFVMLSAHLLVDLFFEGTIRPFYPVSSFELVAPQIEINAIRENWIVISSEGFLLTLNALVVSLGFFAEKFIYFFETQHETVEEFF